MTLVLSNDFTHETRQFTRFNFFWQLASSFSRPVPAILLYQNTFVLSQEFINLRMPSTINLRVNNTLTALLEEIGTTRAGKVIANNERKTCFIRLLNIL